MRQNHSQISRGGCLPTAEHDVRCPLLGEKPTKFAAVRTPMFSQDQAIWAPDAFGCLPTIAVIRSFGCVGSVLIHTGHSSSMDLPTGTA